MLTGQTSKRGSGIVALVAVVLALVAPSASAIPGKHKDTPSYGSPVEAVAPAFAPDQADGLVVADASWAE